MSKITKMDTAIKDLYCKRVDEINNSISQEIWYEELQKQLIDKKKSLSVNENELQEYERIVFELYKKTIDEVYEKAFEDGFRLREVLTPNLTPNS